MAGQCVDLLGRLGGFLVGMEDEDGLRRRLRRSSSKSGEGGGWAVFPEEWIDGLADFPWGTSLSSLAGVSNCSVGNTDAGV